MCKVNRLISVSPTDVELREKPPEEKTLGEEASKNKEPEEMASETTTEGKGTSEGEAAEKNTTEKNVFECGEGSNDGSNLNEHTFSASSELQRITSETKGAETGNECYGSEIDTSVAGLGSHVCDICGFRCTRLVSLASHKDRHLYSMNEYEEDSCDNVLFNVRKKKKRTLKPVTESE
jgi:hypothetical protein